jgi:hypothetical protein
MTGYHELLSKSLFTRFCISPKYILFIPLFNLKNDFNSTNVFLLVISEAFSTDKNILKIKKKENPIEAMARKCNGNNMYGSKWTKQNAGI